MEKQRRKIIINNFDIYSCRSFIEIKKGQDKELKNKRKKRAGTAGQVSGTLATGKAVTEIKPEFNTVNSPVQEIDSALLNRHRELIINIMKADIQLKDILAARDEARYKRDRAVKIKDALADLPLLSTLALSKEKEFYREVYRIRDFSLLSPKNKKPANMFLVENVIELKPGHFPKVLYLSGEEYKNYISFQKKVRGKYKNIEVRFIIDNAYQAFLFLYSPQTVPVYK